MGADQDQLETALVVPETDEPKGDLMSLSSSMSTKDLRAAAKQETTRRSIIAKFVQDHLVDGVDFGVIEDQGKGFKSKPTLYKPGQEKIFSLFGLNNELLKDEETLSMLQDEKGLVAFKCIVYKNGTKIAEGRGAAKIGDKKRDANSTIKIAEKRARMDACLSLGFSEYFTQDMEDPEYRGNGGGNSPPASDKQKDFIRSLMTERGIVEKAEQIYSIARTLEIDPGEVGTLTKDQASTLIEKLQAGDFKHVRPQTAAKPSSKADAVPEAEVVTEVDDPEAAVSAAADAVMADDGPVLVTEEIQKEIIEKLDSLGLNSTGRIRLLKETTGAVSPGTIKTDEGWMKLQTKVDAFLSEEEPIPEGWS